MGIAKAGRFIRHVLALSSVVAVTSAGAYAQTVTSASSEDEGGQFCQQVAPAMDAYQAPVLWFSDAFHNARHLASQSFWSTNDRQVSRLSSRADELHRRIDTLESKINDIVIWGGVDLECPGGDSPSGYCLVPNCLEAPRGYECIEQDLTDLKNKHAGSVKKLAQVLRQIVSRAHEVKPSDRNLRRIKKMRPAVAAMKAELSNYQSKFAFTYYCGN